MNKICVGCGEEKSDTELKLYKKELLCLECRNQEMLTSEFTKLEEKECVITDEIIELESELEYARQNVIKKEKRVQEARNKYRENEMKMVQFDWNRKVIN